MSSIEPTQGFRIRGRHVLFGVVGFFAVVIGLDAIFMVLAIRSFPGQVSETPFEDGLAFNRTIARREAQARLGYRADAEAFPGGIELRLSDRDGAFLTGVTVTGTLTRPATEAGQQTLTFEAAAHEAPRRARGVIQDAADGRGQMRQVGCVRRPAESTRQAGHVVQRVSDDDGGAATKVEQGRTPA